MGKKLVEILAVKSVPAKPALALGLPTLYLTAAGRAPRTQKRQGQPGACATGGGDAGGAEAMPGAGEGADACTADASELEAGGGVGVPGAPFDRVRVGAGGRAGVEFHSRDRQRRVGQRSGSFSRFSTSHVQPHLSHSATTTS